MASSDSCVPGSRTVKPTNSRIIDRRSLALTRMEIDRKMAAEEHGLKTELCLGLPGGVTVKATLKRGFSETVDLKLKLHQSTDESSSDIVKSCSMESKVMLPPKDPIKPPHKAQVVGWPPVRSFRKNVMADHQKSNNEGSDKATTSRSSSGSGVAFVKVSMDGAPYLRKVDLKMHNSYQELSDALGKMFSSFTIGNCGSEGMIDFMNESKVMDVLNSSEYVATYEDQDGDWMLLGDVPWEMFVDSCKRIRIMKGCEAIGLAPRAIEKCRNRC